MIGKRGRCLTAWSRSKPMVRFYPCASDRRKASHTASQLRISTHPNRGGLRWRTRSDWFYSEVRRRRSSKRFGSCLVEVNDLKRRFFVILFRYARMSRSSRRSWSSDRSRNAPQKEKDDPDLAALDIGLKQIYASGAYGIYFECNVSPGDSNRPMSGEVYSDIAFLAPKIHDERPGAFANPIIATLVTGGARLVLAMLECEVTRAGRGFLRHRCGCGARWGRKKWCAMLTAERDRCDR